jgi:hypothetical protein
MEQPRPEPPSTVNREVAEIVFCVPLAQVRALSEVASRLGLTTGQVLRRLIGDFLSRRPAGSGP